MRDATYPFGRPTAILFAIVLLVPLSVGAQDIEEPVAPPMDEADEGVVIGSPSTADEADVSAPPPVAPVPPPSTLPAPSVAAPRMLLPGHAPSSSYVPAAIGSRLSALDANLFALGQRGGNAIVDGVLSTVTGGLLITLGVVADDPRLSTYFYLWGGSSLARAIVHFALQPNASDAAIAFAHMPMNTREEIEARLLFGEATLERLARKARAARLVDGTISIGVGLAVLPIYFGPNGFRFETALDYFVVIGSSLSVVTGILNVVLRSEAERRWRAYKLLRDRLLPEVTARPSARVRLEASPLPLPGGGGIILGARF